MLFNRRQLLVTAIASAPVLVAGAAPAASAAPAPPLLAATIVPGEVATLDIPSGDFASRHAFAYSLSEQVQLSRPAGCRVVVRYDTRLFSASGAAVVAHEDRYEVISTDISQKEPPEQSTVSYSVPDLSDGRTAPLLTIDVPLTVRDNYPHENIDNPLPMTVTILDESDAELARVEWTPQTPEASGLAWGVELEASWRSLGSAFRSPVSVTCTSVGPAPAPAESVLAVVLDSRLGSSCTVTRIAPALAETGADDVSKGAEHPVPWDAAAFDVSEETTDERRTLTITLHRSIEAGSAIEVTLSTATPDPVPAVQNVVYPSVAFSGPSSAENAARATSKYEVTDFTPSASPQGSDVPQGKN